MIVPLVQTNKRCKQIAGIDNFHDNYHLRGQQLSGQNKEKSTESKAGVNCIFIK